MARAHRRSAGVGDPVQAYCDLLEVRWLLSEQAGRDVGDEPALKALAAGRAPPARRRRWRSPSRTRARPRTTRSCSATPDRPALSAGRTRR